MGNGYKGTGFRVQGEALTIARDKSLVRAEPADARKEGSGGETENG